MEARGGRPFLGGDSDSDGSELRLDQLQVVRIEFSDRVGSACGRMPELGFGRAPPGSQLGIGGRGQEVEPELQRLARVGHGRLAGTGFVVDYSKLSSLMAFDPIGSSHPGDSGDIEFEALLGVGGDGVAPRPFRVHLRQQLATFRLPRIVEHR